MEKSAILNADLLDIVFEGRNKEYGAYELRRTYNRRLRRSVAVMFLLTLLLSIGQLLAGRITGKEEKMMDINDQVLTEVKDPKDEPIPPPAEPPPPQKPVKTIQFADPKIAPDEDVKEVMPPQEDLDKNVKIDIADVDGDEFDGVVEPPKSDEGRGIIDAPKKAENTDEIFRKVEIESEYVGGKKAWERFLIKNLHVPQLAIDNEIQGTVIVQFIVDREGNVSKVEAISGPMELRDEAVRVIKKSGKWTPAIQNGMPVPSYKKQPIGFKISSD